MKKKFLLLMLGIMCLFMLIWVVDILLPSWSPDYRPLLSILQVLQALLSVIVGM